MKIRLLEIDDRQRWNDFAHAHPHGTAYHLAEWKSIIEKTYGHKTYYLLAERLHSDDSKNSSYRICGILPLVHIKHFLFGNSLVSMPFLDHGGALAEDVDTESALLREALVIGQNLGSEYIELRHTRVTEGLMSYGQRAPSEEQVITKRSHKVRLVLDLPPTSDILMSSFKSKLRSQIKKPTKEGLTATIGRMDLLDDFYNVFSTNMRDLGSPVHSIRLMENVLDQFSDASRLCIVYKGKVPLACSLIIGFKDVLMNPWASALNAYSRLSPNMLLYWTMLEYSCNNGYRSFDFGRSSPGEGTYNFKEQWGAKPQPLHWFYIPVNGASLRNKTTEKSRFDIAIRLWRKLPVPMSATIGPFIRKHISL